MIPYDDLVAALSAWRARQGLPVNSLGGSGSGPHAPGSGSGPNRAAPPSPPPASAEPLEVGDELLDDAAYENEGNDFAMAFGANPENDGEATQMGEAPERPTEADLGNDRNDW